MRTALFLAFTGAALLLLSASSPQALPLPQHKGLKVAHNLRCTGRQSLVLRGYVIKGRRVALKIAGRCEVKLIGSVVKGGHTGIHVTGRGRLLLLNSTVKGGRYGIYATGRARVAYRSSTIKGGRRALVATRRATVLKGHSKPLSRSRRIPLRRAPTARSKPTPRAARRLTPAAPIRCLGNRSITLRRRIIRTSGTAIKTVGNCTIRLISCTLIAAVGIKISGNGLVSIQDSTIRGSSAAIRLFGNGDVRIKNSTIRGPVTQWGTGRIIKDAKSRFVP